MGPTIDNKLRQTVSGTVFFVTDHLGTTRALADASGSIASNLGYDSYGNVTSGFAPSRYTYAGREIDADSGLMHYRARWYDPQHGRFVSEDPIGLNGGINVYLYVGNNPTNRVDPTGLYEIDVHYYLTYFIASKFRCLTSFEARLIADADQSTDENPDTAPGSGVTESQRLKNMNYHALHSGAHQTHLDGLRNAAMNGNNYVGLGRYLHYLQDTYSHRGYTHSSYGHLVGSHKVDKTATDPGKAADMVRATWFAINDWVKGKKCGCGPADTNVDTWWPTAMTFLKASGGPWYREMNAVEVENKRRILGVPQR